MCNLANPFIVSSSIADYPCCCCYITLDPSSQPAAAGITLRRKSYKYSKHGKGQHDEVKMYQCPVCDYSSMEISKIERHQRMHSGHKPFKCPSCQYESYDKSKIRRHYVTHTREKPFQCELCGSKFTQSGSLKTHLTNVHGFDRVEFRCPFCTKLVTSNMGKLRKHIKSSHHSTNYPLIVNKVNNVTLSPLTLSSPSPCSSSNIIRPIEGQSNNFDYNRMELNFYPQSTTTTTNNFIFQI